MSAISGGVAPVPVGRRVGSKKRYAAARQSRDRFVRFWRRLTQSRKTFAGLVILLIFLLIALFGPWIDSQSPSAMSSAVLQGPSTAHWLGTTQTGQDVAAQLLDGTRFTLLVSFGAAAVATVIALIIGIGGGYLGGIGGEVLSMLSNCFLVIPALPLVIVLAGYLPNKGGISLILVLALTGWAWGARILRAQTLSLRRRDFVLAARVAGERSWRILFSEILPHVMPIAASGFVFTVIFAIVTQSSLAFLGLGDVTTWSWGTMLYWAQNNSALGLGAWWWFVPPGLCIGLVGMALALINFGIDDFVNPRLRVTDLRRRGRRAARLSVAEVLAPHAGDSAVVEAVGK